MADWNGTNPESGKTFFLGGGGGVREGVCLHLQAYLVVSTGLSKDLRNKVSCPYQACSRVVTILLLSFFNVDSELNTIGSVR
jgi:hypothetical protein